MSEQQPKEPMKAEDLEKILGKPVSDKELSRQSQGGQMKEISEGENFSPSKTPDTSRDRSNRERNESERGR